MVESGAIANVITFGDEVVVDLVLHTPAMHIKNVRKTISEKQFLVYPDAKIKINSKVENSRESR
jgi:ATP-binding protein involved in chromosome partitioning